MTPEGSGRSDAAVSETRAWGAVAVLLVFYVLSIMDRGIISLLVTPIRQELSISDVQVGLLQGYAFALFYSLAALPIGWAVDHASRRKLLAAGIVFWSIATAACGLADTFAHLFLARMMVGVGEAVLLPVALSLIADMFPRNRLATANAVFTIGSSVGGAASMAAGGALIRALSEGGVFHTGVFQHLAAWRATFMICGAAGLGVVFLTLTLPNIVRQAEAHGKASNASMAEFGRFLRSRVVVLACAFSAFSLLTCAFGAFHSWAAPHMERTFGWGPATIGLVLGVISLAAHTPGILVGGLMMDRGHRWGLKAPYFTIPLVSTLIGGPLLVVAFLIGSGAVYVGLLALGTFVLTMFGSAHYSVLQLVAPPRFRGRLTALFLLVMALVGSGLGPLLPPLAGAVIGGPHDGLGPGVAVVMAILTPLIALILFVGQKPLQRALKAVEEDSKAPGPAAELGELSPAQ